MICFDQVTPTHSLLLAPHCTAGLHRCTAAAPQHHLPFGTTDTSDSQMNAAMTMSLCHVDLASGHIQQAIPAGQMFAQGAFEGSAFTSSLFHIKTFFCFTTRNFLDLKIGMLNNLWMSHLSVLCFFLTCVLFHCSELLRFKNIIYGLFAFEGGVRLCLYYILPLGLLHSNCFGNFVI